MLTLAPLILARDCFRADAVGPPATETAATTWSLADCTTLDFSCTSSNSSAPAAESGKLCANALQVDEVASLTEALKSEAPNLVSLELRGNWVGPLKGAALATALQAHPSLEFLGLASTALGDVGGTALARRLLLQEAPPALRRVDLSHNHLGDDCARARRVAQGGGRPGSVVQAPSRERHSSPSLPPEAGTVGPGWHYTL